MAPERAAVIDALKRIFDEATDGRVSELELREDMAIIDDIGLHSIDLLEIAYRIEKQWDLTIDNDTYKGLRTVGDVVELVLAKGQSSAPAETAE